MKNKNLSKIGWAGAVILTIVGDMALPVAHGRSPAESTLSAAGTSVLEKAPSANGFIKIIDNNGVVAEVQVLKAGGKFILASGLGVTREDKYPGGATYKATGPEGVRVQIAVEGQRSPVEIIAAEIQMRDEPVRGLVPKGTLRLQAGGETVAEARVVDGPWFKTIKSMGPVRISGGETNPCRTFVGLDQRSVHLQMTLAEQDQPLEVIAEKIEYCKVTTAAGAGLPANASTQAAPVPLERKNWPEAFGAIPVLSVLPTESDLGEGWKRSRMLMMDPVSQPPEINDTILPESVLEKRRAELREPQAQVSGFADVHFEGPEGLYSVQLSRRRSTTPLMTNWVEGYRRTMVRDIGDSAVAYYGQGGMSLWFVRDNFKVVISRIDSAKTWKGDTSMRHLARTMDKLIVAAAKKAQSGGLHGFNRANGEDGAEKVVSIGRIIATVSQLGEGWSSNRIEALIEPLDTPAERADPGVDPGWMGFARGAITNGNREAYAMVRYNYRDRHCTVWIQRWQSKDLMPKDWGRDKETKDSPGTLPKVGEEVRFSQRHGMHNNIDFVRGRYLIMVESPLYRRGQDIEHLKHLAEVLDANFLKAK